MTTVTPGAVEVRQEDREAAADLMFEQFTHSPGLEGDGAWSEVVRRGEDDAYPFVQAFARHRIAATPPDALQTVVEAWQPIESAPKMREVLLWADTSTPDFPNWRMASGYFHTGMNVWIWGGEQVREWAFPPTHWQPLPKPPSLAGGDL